ncbi:MAG: hypothetical protein AB8B56_11200 [Crocinitomicaceae bacterium]
MKKGMILCALAFGMAFVSCKKDEVNVPQEEVKVLAESTVNFEGMGDILVKTVQNEKGQVSYDYGAKENDVNAFFESNPDYVTLINYDENEKAEVTIITSEESRLFPKEEDGRKLDESIHNRSGFEYTVTFYDDNNFSDRYLRINKSYSSHYDSDLKDTYSTNPWKKGFNDKTSSLRIESPEYKSLRVRLYDDKNYQDTKIILTVSADKVFTIANLGFENIFSSTQNVVTTNTTKWWGAYYTPKFNDKLSSFKIDILY